MEKSIGSKTQYAVLIPNKENARLDLVYVDLFSYEVKRPPVEKILLFIIFFGQ